MFRRIVVPLDGTAFAEAALTPARELARAYDARIEIVRALPPDGHRSGAFADDELRALGRTLDAETYAHGVVDRLRTQGYKADLSLRFAQADVGILAIAEADHADVIVMSTHLRWKVAPLGGASTTLRVFGRSKTPILVWRVPGARADDGGWEVYGRTPTLARTESPILVPLDGSTYAERALEPAETLAKAFGPYLLLAHAVESGASRGGETLRERGAIDYLERIRAEVEQRGVHAAIAVRHGTAFGVIDRLWREYDAGLVVIASHGRTAPFGTLLGSVAARLMEEIEAPLLVLPPADLSTPAGATTSAVAWHEVAFGG
jgi:nucleotide-binding universal stress UspA family protein